MQSMTSEMVKVLMERQRLAVQSAEWLPIYNPLSYRAGKCATEEPEFTEIEPGHQVAFHFLLLGTNSACCIYGSNLFT
jgi:hypothetical protein